MVELGTLPTSGRAVVVREPAGRDELVVLDGAGSPVETVLVLARRLVADIDDWSALPAVDLAAAALLIRRVWIGPMIEADGHCQASGCGERIDITFGIGDYLEHHRPRRPRGVVEGEPGWFTLAGAEVTFRIPTIGDLTESPMAALERCVRTVVPAPALLRRIERALEALAPPLAGELAGRCPHCGASVALWFDPIDWVLAELRDASRSLFGQVHELALAYHWSEPAILDLDRRRRYGYVELVRGDLVA